MRATSHPPRDRRLERRGSASGSLRREPRPRRRASSGAADRADRTPLPRPMARGTMRGPMTANDTPTTGNDTRTTAKDAPAPLIRARGLTKKFDDFTAVDAIDFDVASGESFGFLGPNGAGKTSTMRMVGC